MWTCLPSVSASTGMWLGTLFQKELKMLKVCLCGEGEKLLLPANLPFRWQMTEQVKRRCPQVVWGGLRWCFEVQMRATETPFTANTHNRLMVKASAWMKSVLTHMYGPVKSLIHMESLSVVVQVSVSHLRQTGLLWSWFYSLFCPLCFGSCSQLSFIVIS